MKITQTDNIKIEGHIGTWYEIEVYEQDEIKIILLEHETFGDEASWLVVNAQDGKVLSDECFDYTEFHSVVKNFKDEWYKQNELKPIDKAVIKEQIQMAFKEVDEGKKEGELVSAGIVLSELDVLFEFKYANFPHFERYTIEYGNELVVQYHVYVNDIDIVERNTKDENQTNIVIAMSTELLKRQFNNSLL